MAHCAAIFGHSCFVLGAAGSMVVERSGRLASNAGDAFAEARSGLFGVVEELRGGSCGGGVGIQSLYVPSVASGGVFVFCLHDCSSSAVWRGARASRDSGASRSGAKPGKCSSDCVVSSLLHDPLWFDGVLLFSDERQVIVV